jgi:cysteine desulfurase
VNRSDFILPEAFLACEQGGPSCLSFSAVHFGGLHLPAHFIHLDYASSTPVHREVFAAMEPWLMAYFGNPASHLHAMGALAEAALCEARATVASALGVGFENLIFTASATESNNLILRGLVESPTRRRKKIIFAATEHASVVTTARALAANFGPSLGIYCEEIPVDACGQLDMAAAQKMIDDDTLLVCVMDVNNETGVLQERLSEIIDLAHRHGAWVHVDAVQGFGRGEFTSKDLDWDTLCISSGKIYGPRGAAALAVRSRSPRIRFEPQLTGGGHEFGLRSSTPNVAALVGFSRAVELQLSERDARNRHLNMLSEAFCAELRGKVEFKIYAKNGPRVPGILMLSFADVNAMKLIENAKRVAVSVGSACRSLHGSASHVLLAMGVPLDEALAGFRVSFGLPNSVEEVRDAARVLAENAGG